MQMSLNLEAHSIVGWASLSIYLCGSQIDSILVIYIRQRAIVLVQTLNSN